MSTMTYYLVQVNPTTFVQRTIGEQGLVQGFGAKDAAQFSIGEARRIYRKLCLLAEGGARRFPRIIKVTTTMKTITSNR